MRVYIIDKTEFDNIDFDNLSNEKVSELAFISYSLNEFVQQFNAENIYAGVDYIRII